MEKQNKYNPWIAAAILIFQVVVKLSNIGHFVAPNIFRKSHGSVPVNSQVVMKWRSKDQSGGTPQLAYEG